MSFWRQENPELDDDGGVITGGMWPHQRKAWNSKAFIKALVTGYGGGKTFFAGKRAISMALHNAPSPYMLISPSYKQAKRTVIPTIKSLLDGRGIPHTYNKSEHEFNIFYKGLHAVIWIGSGQNADDLKGPNICGAGIDEPFIQPVEVFEQMLARVRDPRAKYREITLTGTPEQLNWGYDICEGERKGDYDLELIQASSTANQALDQQYFDTLTNAYDDKLKQAYVDGAFVNMAKGVIYYGFDRHRNVKELIKPESCQYEIGMDFNVNPMAAVVFWRDGDRMHYVEEVELPNSDTNEMMVYLTTKYPEIKKAYPDPACNQRRTNAPAGLTDKRIIESKAFGVKVHARKAHPSRRDRYNATNKKYADGSLTLDPSLKRLRKYCEQLTHENFAKTDGEPMTHLTDAASYPVEYVFPIKRPTSRKRRYV